MKTSDFYYDLPPELIAQTPLERRDGSRLLTLDKRTGETGHGHFYDLPRLLRPGDCLVMNDSRVLPARLLGRREPTGGAAEVLLLVDRGDQVWECLVRPGRKVKPGTRLSFGEGALTAEVLETLEGGNRLIRFDYEGIFLETLERLGKMPLPPYIKEELNDPERYQTVYSRQVGSAAAPTAGLHFTRELLDQIQAMGVSLCYVTLHVGLGTFRPVKEDEITDHEMHAEYCMIPQETADIINRTKQTGGRVVCVGTTSCRTIESWAGEDGTLKASAGWTDIFIYPGYRFKVLDALVTNFHLPESTLVMLVSALAGREHILAAYEEAVRERYRFFSFGDAMFIY
ncbi:MAG: tRNA preQ1(34) S-adenosylmethionine ribosyltransferase-isomerase QueA [Clostridiales bacterium]|uniref:tRNA preQ1(34) S-adenosylmethionine ribosyltransferase-isomerase QueA n=1 Tax=Intestinimonas sp. TaxID=1965293 RepID=UPI001D40E847|nr:tRNA preQ1(34) S-adenosylmethionine ribosyltransferase-isomerase QueA [Intestinimonas sp.]MBS6283090.1 tRNA preQ1(34) S-adenosylmethionine ribosyltransferase-isomerase QueA [Oscillospiraceae bacterium]MDU1324311.1 tRNA preQ1(34) S-adenosylmethionine ribosyltransferase-isomerase QueA [Clostridiales bacterium]MDY5338356.1 tRNA preQ1(34) S-adenosylmethionine ribosyltransferase-isomerase QueA [Intestinimonas sp.]